MHRPVPKDRSAGYTAASPSQPYTTHRCKSSSPHAYCMRSVLRRSHCSLTLVVFLTLVSRAPQTSSITILCPTTQMATQSFLSTYDPPLIRLRPYKNVWPNGGVSRRRHGWGWGRPRIVSLEYGLRRTNDIVMSVEEEARGSASATRSIEKELLDCFMPVAFSHKCAFLMCARGASTSSCRFVISALASLLSGLSCLAYAVSRPTSLVIQYFATRRALIKSTPTRRHFQAQSGPCAIS